VSWKVVVLARARDEIDEAADWYRRESQELCLAFLKAVEVSLQSLTINPRIRSRRHPSEDVRWLQLKPFPYRIIYRILSSDQTVFVLMVLHASRDDRHWKRRINEERS